MNALSIPDAPAWFNAMLNLSLQATLLAGLVWIVLKAVGRWIPPSWRALMWFLVIARVLIPYSPPSPFSLQNLFISEPNQPAAVAQELPDGAAVMRVRIAPETPVETISSYAAPLSPAETKPIRYTRVFTVIWGGAASFFIALLVARGLMIRYRLVRHGLPAPAFILEQLEICRAELRVRFPIRVTASDRIVAPALTGLIPARLIIPKEFAPPQFTISQIRQILLHELAHVQQGHLFLHWLALIARAIHWFNPAIHLAAIQLRQECELAADTAALKRCSAEERAVYGETILEVLAQSQAPRTALVLGMAEEARHLRQRLHALTAKRRAFGPLGLACVVLIGLTGLTGKSLERKDSSLPSANREGLHKEAAPNATAIRDARFLVELGRLEEAEQFLRQMLSVNPNDRAAKDLLGIVIDQQAQKEKRRQQIAAADSETNQFGKSRPAADDVEKSWNNPSGRELLPRANSLAAAPTATQASPGRAALYRKLATLRVDDFPIVSPVDLVEVLKELGSELRKRDSSGRGVNLIISQGSSPGPSGAAPIDVEKFQIKFDPPLRNVTLGQFFDALVRVAEPPPGAPPTARLKYTVEDYAIVFSEDIPESNGASSKSWQSSNRESLGVPSPEIPPSSIARQKVIEKLDGIRIDDFPLTSWVDLIEVLKELAHETRKRDPEARGINFVIDQTNGRVFNPPIDVGLFQIKIDPPVRNVTLRQLCDIMVRVAKPPDGAPTAATLEYRIADYGVVFGLRARETEEFVSRTFKIEPNVFLKALDSTLPRRAGTGINDIQQQVRAFAEYAGVSFPTNAANQAEQKLKAIFYNDRTGVLYARATPRELDQIENAIHALNAVPPIVSIRVEAAEIPRELKLLIEKEIPMSDQTPLLATNEFLFVSPKDSSGEPLLMGTKSLRDKITDPVAVAHVTFPAIQTVLSPEDARTLRERLKQARDVDILAAPNVTTLLGRGARISVEETQSIVTPKTVKSGGVPAPVGFMVDCLGEDFDGINMHLNCTVNMTEFLEYDKAGDAPLPKFRVRSIGSRTKLAPGSTQVFLMPKAAPKRVPVLADIPHLGQLFEAPGEAGRYVLILITTVIVDSAGNIVVPKSN